MKLGFKLFLVLIFFLSLGFTKSEQTVKTKLLGTWENTALDVVYEFGEEYVYFSQGGFGQQMEYTIDDSHQPVWVDFTLKQGTITLKIPGLLELKNDTTLVIEQFAPSSDHPTEFTKEPTLRNQQHLLVKSGQ